MLTVQLRQDELEQVSEIVGDLAKTYQSVESPDFQREARTYADELPRALRRAVHGFRSAEAHGALVLTGFPVDDGAIGPTPEDWKRERVPSPTLTQDIVFFLVSSLLGEPIGWATQQAGRVMHDIFPVKAHEHEQIGSGSAQLLTWHTEDAYHPLRTDYLGLMCMRNHDKVETTMADIDDVALDAETRAVLSEEKFHILPDKSHRAQNGSGIQAGDPRAAELQRRSYERVEQLLAEPESVAILFGDPASPYLRIDPYFMQGAQGEKQQEALEKIEAAIDAAMTDVVLAPGDICFIDNYRVVHGRKPFQARFDGTDRWLRRLNIARDLRKSRGSRLGAESRVIY
ncbi:clavaminate synthase family protein [Amycolatopsis minnesotensis]|uniref:Clavaminate synthase family protein n=1 Tax=Amycolatopsis minnesotensis TaxID=337894 RepID=A0ABP5ED56_9PSEU